MNKKSTLKICGAIMGLLLVCIIILLAVRAGNDKNNSGTEPETEAGTEQHTIIIIEAGEDTEPGELEKPEGISKGGSNEESEHEFESSDSTDWETDIFLDREESNAESENEAVSWTIDPVSGSPVPVINDRGVSEKISGTGIDGEAEMEIIESLETSDWSGEFMDDGVKGEISVEE